MNVNVFTDGACSGNPGVGGWAAVFAFKEGIKIISGGEEKTTNNRMELTSVIEAIKFANKNNIANISINSDSSYVVNAINSNWIGKWKEKGWKNSKNEDVKNKDLWIELIRLIEDRNVNVCFVKVKGHSGNTLNDVADKEAVKIVKMIKEVV